MMLLCHHRLNDEAFILSTFVFKYLTRKGKIQAQNLSLYCANILKAFCNYDTKRPESWRLRKSNNNNNNN